MFSLYRFASLPAALLLSGVFAAGQQPSTPGTPAPTQPSNGGGQRSGSRSSSQQTDPFRGPMFISGRIVSELNRPVTEPVSVELNCGMKAVQVIHTDLGGYFTFTLGGGFQSNIDFSASNETPSSFGTPTQANSNPYGSSLSGCEVRVSVAGYRPANYPLPPHSDIGRVDLGNLQLNRISDVKGSDISVTSLLVPKDASKEFEKALKEIRNNHPEAAEKDLEKAVAIYDKYAAAWNELGRIYIDRGDQDKAAQAFARSAAADPEYLPPLVNLATLQIQSKEWEDALATSTKALDLDSSMGFARFLQAVANFNLNHLDAAEKSAHEVEKVPHDDIPQLYALLAEIYLHKQDYPHAATYMKTYLQESPDGQYAQRMKDTLQQIETVDTSDRAAASATATAAPSVPEELPVSSPDAAPAVEDEIPAPPPPDL